MAKIYPDVIHHDNFTIDKISFDPPKTFNICKDIIFVSIRYDSHSLYLQTPIVYFPWGLNSPDGNSKNQNSDLRSIDYRKYGYNFQFTNTPDPKFRSTFKDNLKRLEEKVIDHVCENYKTFFPKIYNKFDTPEDIIKFVKRAFCPIIKYDNLDEPNNHPPTVNTNIIMRYGRFQCDVFNYGYQEVIDIPLNKLDLYQVNAESILFIDSIWCKGNWFGVRLICRKLRLQPKHVHQLAMYPFTDPPVDNSKKNVEEEVSPPIPRKTFDIEEID